MNNRIEQLDSLRGLAAFSVFMSHLPLASVSLPLLISHFLKAIGLLNGYGSVILFFVLSGFVLSIPFLEKENNPYIPYLIKRIFRIYIPYVFAISFTIVLSQLFLTNEINELTELSDKFWNTPISLNLIIEHIYLIGNIHSNSFNGVIWSLIHELRISLIFPFILFIVKRLNWDTSIILCLILSIVSGLNNIFQFQISNGYLITYFETIHCTSIFIIGALLAKHRIKIINMYKNSHFITKCVILLLSFLFYNFSGMVSSRFFGGSYYLILADYGMVIGVIGFMMTAMGSVRVAKILMKKPISFIGKISYSLYLYHLPVLLMCIYLFYDKLPLWSICVIGVVLSIMVSFIAWYTVENPFMKLGRRIADSLKTVKRTQTVEKLDGNVKVLRKKTQ